MKSAFQLIFHSRGSIAHAGQFFSTNASILKGDCTVQPIHLSNSPSHLIMIIRKFSMNSVTVWTPLLSQLLQVARRAEDILSTLQSLEVVMTLGAPLPPSDLQWAYENKIPILNYFALTETAGLLHTALQRENDPAPDLFRPIEGAGVRLLPTQASSDLASQNILEVVVPSDSPIFPGASFASTIDGHFHTGDFFEEIVPGRYEYRGRMDDWIKMSNATRCNTKAIEEHIRSSCQDLISECVVVGSGRDFPAVLVEKNPTIGIEDANLKKEIVSRSRDFNSRRYVNEQVPGEKFVFIVEAGELPRTALKGNVRRKAVEEKYKTLLDDVYTQCL